MQEHGLEAIIEKQNRKYVRLKNAYEKKRILKIAERKSQGSDRKAEIIAELSKEAKSNPFYSHPFPEKDFYKKVIAPGLVKLTQDSAEFQRLSEISLKALENIAELYIDDDGNKKAAAEEFFKQYFDFLHKENEKTVLGMARIQSRMVSGNDSFRERPLEEYKVKNIFQAYIQSRNKKFLPEIVDIAGNIENSNMAANFIEKGAELLNYFKDKGAEDLIPVYLRLARAKKFPSYDFQFDKEECLEQILLLKLVKEHIDKVVELCELSFKKRLPVWGDLSDSIKNLVAMVTDVKNNKGLAKELPALLDTAIELSRQGINGTIYLRLAYLIKKATQGNSRIFLEYAFDLGKISPACADSYLRNGDDSFQLPLKLKQKYHDVGLKIAKEFGEKGDGYFRSALYVLKYLPERFDEWLSRLTLVGRVNLDILGKFEFSSAAFIALRNNRLDKLVDASLIMDARIKEFNKAEEKEGGKKRVLTSFPDPFSTLINTFHDALDLGINIYQYTGDIMKSYKKDILWLFHPLSMVAQGLDYTKYIELLMELQECGLNRAEFAAKIRNVVNSDIHLNKKSELLKEYSLAAYVLKEDVSELDFEGRWKDECRGKLAEKTKAEFSIEPVALELSDLLKLASIRKHDIESKNNIEKLIYIINETMAKRSIPKHFPLGKTYGSLIVGGLKSKQDPVHLTEQLVYGLISRDPAKKKAAEEFFEPEKLEQARKLIQKPTTVFSSIRQDFEMVKQGSREAAKKVLDYFSQAYPKQEAISDMVVGIKSIFDEDIRFDRLELAVQKSVFADLFDNRRTWCCAFFPTGAQKKASINYLLNPNIGLLHLVPKIREEHGEPVGVITCARTYNPDNNEKYLVIDSVEAGSQIDRIKDNAWILMVHEGMISLAKDLGFDKIIYNVYASNAKPQSVISYLKKNYSPKQEEVYLLIPQEPSVLDSFVRKYINGFNYAVKRAEKEKHQRQKERKNQDSDFRSPYYEYSYEARQVLGNIKKMVKDNYALFFEAWGNWGFARPREQWQRFEEFEKESFRELPSTLIGGETTGLVFEVKK